ncbi:hypothetical protein [Streptomyces sp. NPDC050164]|uniref:hypothetical protein n=1 Tax=Streptomyces sp. NPDC050164 TaxID=3365605 RepID=UPI003798EC99
MKARTQSGPPSSATISGWLASGHPSPSTARREWDSAAGLAMIPLGHSFDAVRIPANVVHAATGSTDPSVVEARLAQYLNDGPVIHDPGFARYYVLVPPGTVYEWPSPVVECLGEATTYLGVPRVDRIGLDEETQASYWSVVIPRPGVLCKAADVVALVMAGGCLSDDEDDES